MNCLNSLINLTTGLILGSTSLRIINRDAVLISGGLWMGWSVNRAS